uniref:hypothetical protein n=1 Tax=Stieleria sp. TaxID=2795976 RepID=UPI003562ED84
PNGTPVPLLISTEGIPLFTLGTFGGTVNIEALNDIAIRQNERDLLVYGITSQGGGDVYVDAASGRILDARMQTTSSVLEEDQIQGIWDDLTLLATSDPATDAATSAAKSIPLFEQQIESNYRLYWRLRENGTYGTVGDDQTFSLNVDAVDLFREEAANALTEISAQERANRLNQNLENDAFQEVPDVTPGNISDSDVRDYAKTRYLEVVDFFDSNPNAEIPANFQILAPNWRALPEFQTFNENYAYTATTDQQDALTANSVWTEEQLRYALNQKALQPSPGGLVGLGIPNISGGNVTINAQDGLGMLDAPMVLSFDSLLNGTLTTEEQKALAGANNPGDIQIGAAEIRIKQTSPLFIDASGKVIVISGGEIFLQSTMQDLEVEYVSADGNVSLTAPQTIQSTGAVSPSINVTSGDLTLVAGTGNIGTSAVLPLEIQVSGAVSQASAGEDIFLRNIGGDLRFDQIVAGESVNLYVPAGGLQHVQGTGITAKSLVFNVQTGVDGTSDALPLNLDADGGLTGLAGGTIHIVSPNTSLKFNNVVSGGGDVLAIVDGDAKVGRVSATGTVDIIASGNILDGVDASVSPQPDGLPNIFAPNAMLSAGRAIGDEANPLETSVSHLEADTTFGGIWLFNFGNLEVGGINPGAGVTARGSIDIATSGNLTVSQPVHSDQDSVRLAATGDVLQNADVTTAATATIQLSADIDALGGGGITMSEDASVICLGLIDLDASGDITLGRLWSDIGVTVNTTSGSVVDGNDVTVAETDNIIAPTAVLQAGVGVGTLTNPIETWIGKLEGVVGAAGLFVDDANGLIIGRILNQADGIATDGLSAFGPVHVSTTGSMTIVQDVTSISADVELTAIDSLSATENILVTGGATVYGGDDVRLLAGDDIRVDLGASVDAFDLATLAADYVPGGSSDQDRGVGGRVDLLGTVGARIFHVHGGADRDTFNLNGVVSQGILLAEGRGQIDDFTVEVINSASAPVLLFGDHAAVVDLGGGRTAIESAQTG